MKVKVSGKLELIQGEQYSVGWNKESGNRVQIIYVDNEFLAPLLGHMEGMNVTITIETRENGDD